MANYVNSSAIGVDLNNSNATAQFALGTSVKGSNGSDWVYVYMSGACTAGNCVVISATGTAASATIALAMAAPTNTLAFAQSTFSAADYGWVCRNGINMTVGMSATTAAITTALYIGVASPGHLSTTVGSATVIGVNIAGSSATAAAWTGSGTINWPYIAMGNLTNS